MSPQDLDCLWLKTVHVPARPILGGLFCTPSYVVGKRQQLKGSWSDQTQALAICGLSTLHGPSPGCGAERLSPSSGGGLPSAPWVSSLPWTWGLLCGARGFSRRWVWVGGSFICLKAGRHLCMSSGRPPPGKGTCS